MVGGCGLLLLLLFACLLAETFYHHALMTQEEMLRDQTGLVARQTSRALADVIDDYVVEMQWLAHMPLTRLPHPEDHLATLASMFRDKMHFTSVFRLDRNGICTFYYSANAELLAGVVGKDFSFRQYFQRVRETLRPVVSDPLTSGGPHDGVLNKFAAIVVAVPLLGPDGEFDGVIGTDIAIENLAREFIWPIRVQNEGGGWLLCADGRVVVSPPGDEFDAILHKAYEAGLTEGDVVKRLTLADAAADDEIVEVAMARLGGTRWFVAVEAPRALVTRQVSPLFWRLLALMLGVTAVVVVGVGIILRQMAKVERLTTQIRELEIMIDESRQKQEVSAITSSDYFQDLLNKVDSLRAQG